MTTSNASVPPGAGASDMWILIVSPGFMSSVSLLFTNVAASSVSGPGGPVGTPFRWMKAKLAGSSQAGLAFVVGVPVKLSMVSAAHQCVSSQLVLLMKGGWPGGYSCISMNAEPPPWVVAPQLTPKHVGALESDSGVQGVPGKELGSHMAMDNHGAGLSSTQCEMSWPGFVAVPAACGSRPRVSVKFTLLPDPGALDKKVVSGSSWPMYLPLS